jgi:cob(I)alamin adenosyltransferase
MKSRVTTGVGDQGTTRTLSGETLPKSDLVLECTGWLDALRANIAAIRIELLASEREDARERADFLFWLLHVCFLIGTEVNDPRNTKPEYRHEVVSKKHLKRLEAEQAALEAQLNLPRAFIACAANAIAADIDVAATVVRTLERNLVRLQEQEPAFAAGDILRFVNRLSDFMFVLARYLEDGHHQAVDYGVLDA